MLQFKKMKRLQYISIQPWLHAWEVHPSMQLYNVWRANSPHCTHRPLPVSPPSIQLAFMSYTRWLIYYSLSTLLPGPSLFLTAQQTQWKVVPIVYSLPAWGRWRPLCTPWEVPKLIQYDLDHSPAPVCLLPSSLLTTHCLHGVSMNIITNAKLNLRAITIYELIVNHLCKTLGSRELAHAVHCNKHVPCESLYSYRHTHVHGCCSWLHYVEQRGKNL